MRVIFDADGQLSWPRSNAQQRKLGHPSDQSAVGKPIKCPPVPRQPQDMASSVDSDQTVLRVASTVLSSDSDSVASSPKSSKSSREVCVGRTRAPPTNCGEQSAGDSMQLRHAFFPPGCRSAVGYPHLHVQRRRHPYVLATAPWPGGFSIDIPCR